MRGKKFKQYNQGTLIAQANINFNLILEEVEITDPCCECFEEVNEKKYFKFNFAIEGTDYNLYPFTFMLLSQYGAGPGASLEWLLGVLPAKVDFKHPDFIFKTQVTVNNEVFLGQSRSSELGPNGCKNRGACEDCMWTFGQDSYQAFRDFIRPSESDICNPNKIKIKIEIYEDEDNKKILGPKVLQFLKSKRDKFEIICEDEDGKQIYYINENLMIKESDVFEALTNGQCMEGKTKRMTFTDVNKETLKSVLTFCRTNTIPMTAINEDLVVFVEKYNMENLMDVIDRIIAMSVDHKIDERWIFEWIPKLKMIKSGIRLNEYLAYSKISKNRKKYANLVYNGADQLTRGKKLLALKNACKGNKELAVFLASLIGVKEEFPKYSDLKCSKNVLMLIENDDEKSDVETEVSEDESQTSESDIEMPVPSPN